MKPQPAGTKTLLSVTKIPGAALSLREELVAAIHGAFEVAVEIAVREVTELVGQATENVYEEMRQENESLKLRLERAEAMLDCARTEDRGGSSPSPPPPPPTKQLLNATNQTQRPPHPKYNNKSPNPKAGDAHVCAGVRGDAPPAGRGRADQPPLPQQERMSRSEEQRSGGDGRTQHATDGASDPERNDRYTLACDSLIKEVSKEISSVCVVRVESINQPCRDLAAQDAAPLPSGDEKSALEQVTVKQEMSEEESDGSACSLDAIKVEDFSHECMSAVQSSMLEEWKPEVLDIQSQDSNSPLSCTGLARAHPSNLTTNLPPPTDLPSLSSEFPNIFELAEPPPIPESPPQVYGVHVRSGRNLAHAFTNFYACKSCGQTFHLPSLLRRHYGQCLQKLQQCCQQPVAGSKRTRVQLYPPGCSPFRCTECNREFNRMENLKTHLRIHTGERPYTCSVCSKCFRHSGALTRHFRIHTGEKPYICGQCGKSFRNCGGLKFHQRSHSKQLQ